MHNRLDKAEQRQIENVIKLARKHSEVREPKAFDRLLEEEAAEQRQEECLSDRDEALAELSAHFGVRVLDVVRMGENPGHVALDVEGKPSVVVGTMAGVLGQTSVLSAFAHNRVSMVQRVKPEKWLRVASLIMTHQRMVDVGDEEEKERINDYVRGIEKRKVERLDRVRLDRINHYHEGELYLFVNANNGLTAKELGLTRPIYHVLREAGFRERTVKTFSTTRHAWVRPDDEG